MSGAVVIEGDAKRLPTTARPASCGGNCGEDAGRRGIRIEDNVDFV